MSAEYLTPLQTSVVEPIHNFYNERSILSQKVFNSLNEQDDSYFQTTFSDRHSQPYLLKLIPLNIYEYADDLIPSMTIPLILSFAEIAGNNSGDNICAYLQHYDNNDVDNPPQLGLRIMDGQSRLFTFEVTAYQPQQSLSIKTDRPYDLFPGKISAIKLRRNDGGYDIDHHVFEIELPQGYETTFDSSGWYIPPSLWEQAEEQKITDILDRLYDPSLHASQEILKIYQESAMTNGKFLHNFLDRIRPRARHIPATYSAVLSGSSFSVFVEEKDLQYDYNLKSLVRGQVNLTIGPLVVPPDGSQKQLDKLIRPGEGNVQDRIRISLTLEKNRLQSDTVIERFAADKNVFTPDTDADVSYFTDPHNVINLLACLRRKPASKSLLSQGPGMKNLWEKYPGRRKPRGGTKPQWRRYSPRY
ncbi:hypothetical protein A2W14_02590 [Candidatus Gottesmanbacteria bacterium RBG_16_37_8]|uniref:Uncharacterized protein n=1 Tax=Candidatus Gottesmanbacteria bacterium RBG_16_37_8 TaxID=1798371 RepID=A0A1F5YQ74_9BACT|nr:MAG: hypothetical protein A2W14_02590 [Candidatus Gottesmanbacteria bacterium RBG_16_37_8]